MLEENLVDLHDVKKRNAFIQGNGEIYCLKGQNAFFHNNLSDTHSHMFPKFCIM